MQRLILLSNPHRNVIGTLPLVILLLERIRVVPDQKLDQFRIARMLGHRRMEGQVLGIVRFLNGSIIGFQQQLEYRNRSTMQDCQMEWRVAILVSHGTRFAILGRDNFDQVRVWICSCTSMMQGCHSVLVFGRETLLVLLHQVLNILDWRLDDAGKMSRDAL